MHFGIIMNEFRFRPIAKASMEINDKFLFSFIKETPFQVRPEVVNPPETAALAAAAESGELRQDTPATLAMCENEGDQFVVLISSPRTFLDTKFVATRLPAHDLIANQN